MRCKVSALFKSLGWQAGALQACRCASASPWTDGEPGTVSQAQRLTEGLTTGTLTKDASGKLASVGRATLVLQAEPDEASIPCVQVLS